MKKGHPVLYISVWMISVTAIHMFVPRNQIYVHVLLRFLYIIPILLAGKSWGKWYGLSAAILSAILYSPHFLFREAPAVFHVEGIVWLAMFCVIGYVSGTYSDFKKDYLKLKYDAVAVDRQHTDGSVLFYADDTPLTKNCATWLAKSGLLAQEEKMIVLYGPSYADAASGEAAFLDNKSISLARLKGILKDTGISSDLVEVKLIDPGKRTKLSQKIIEVAESSNCNLILIGKHPLSKPQEFLFGDTAVSLIRESTIPVAVVPNR